MVDETRTIYLIRHGSIELPDRERRYIGQVDLPLDETGEEQAEALRQRFAGFPIAKVYCSDLCRSQRTAEILAAGRPIPIRVRPDLREINLGAWEGCSCAEIERRFPDEFRKRGGDIVNYRVPGGETFAECGRRVLAAFRDILRATTGDILIVGHAGTNRAILCHLTGAPLRDLFAIRQDYCCVNVVRESAAGLQVLATNALSPQGSGR